ncbi:MAG: GNAT family N-acetyltransferase, partial [Thermoleophilaceae bacterium]|nr:GNAT family N-acetyltransferase [Thermoleophilaceae bacterium]
VYLQHYIERDELWTTDDLAGASLWGPPGNWSPSLRETLQLAKVICAPSIIWRAPLVASGVIRAELMHPKQPLHYHLAVLGAEPSMQGRGIGSALLRPVLEQCDHDGIGAYLESSKEENIAFYARHGFRVTRYLDLPRGPRVHMMWRDPQN